MCISLLSEFQFTFVPVVRGREREVSTTALKASLSYNLEA
jgi:hypothetical protein